MWRFRDISVLGDCACRGQQYRLHRSVNDAQRHYVVVHRSNSLLLIGVETSEHEQCRQPWMSEASRLTRVEENYKTRILEHVSVSYYGLLDAVFGLRHNEGEAESEALRSYEAIKGSWRL